MVFDSVSPNFKDAEFVEQLTFIGFSFTTKDFDEEPE